MTLTSLTTWMFRHYQLGIWMWKWALQDSPFPILSSQSIIRSASCQLGSCSALISLLCADTSYLPFFKDSFSVLFFPLASPTHFHYVKINMVCIFWFRAQRQSFPMNECTLLICLLDCSVPQHCWQVTSFPRFLKAVKIMFILAIISKQTIWIITVIPTKISCFHRPIHYLLQWTVLLLICRAFTPRWWKYLPSSQSPIKYGFQ